MLAYMPYIPHVHLRVNELTWPHVRGRVGHPLIFSSFMYTDIV